MCAVHLFIRDTLADVLHVGVDVLHVGKAQQDFGKVLLADGSHPLGVGEKLNFQYLSLEVVHKSEQQKSGEGDAGGNGQWLPVSRYRLQSPSTCRNHRT